MSERKLVVDQLKFSYDGLFNVSEIFTLISDWFYDKGYDWYEKMNQEHVTPEGKQIRIILKPWKKLTDYYKSVIRMKIHFLDIEDIEIDQGGKSLRLNKGQIKIIFDGYLISDYENKWTDQPFRWMLSFLLERYFYRSHFRKGQTWVESDIEDLHQRIKSYLNTFKYNYRNE
jgi:hypothetical protein